MACITWLFRVIVVSWSVLSAAGCFAGEATTTAGPRWTCWYVAGDEAINCLLARAPEGGYAVDAVAAERARHPRLPEVVRVIWGSPDELAGYRVRIPVWTPPIETAFARELAESVMCGSRTDCSVTYDPNNDGRAALRAAARETGAPESEVMRELTAQGLALAAADTASAPVPEEAPRRTSTRRRNFSNWAS